MAGAEAALQLADHGWQIELYEMRPAVQTPAHRTGDFGELVCSNSWKSLLINTAAGLLKKEMEMMNCRLLPIAYKSAVPSGNALALDRQIFSQLLTREIESCPNITIHREEVREIPSEQTILASGPLTSEALTRAIIKLIGTSHLYFFDAIAPIITADSIDKDRVFARTRYDKGTADYLNCPFTPDQYHAFVDALTRGKKYHAHDFENDFFQDQDFNFYENCIPLEELARRGVDTLRFGVMRPVGLADPRTGERPYAVIQLRAENQAETAYNLVGCQTMLLQGEQKRIFRLVPGLEKAEFLRLGSIHRNTYLNSPAVLNENLQFRKNPGVYLAGQLSGVEGYVESVLSGLLISRIIAGDKRLLPATTISGQLWRHLITPVENFQPMNANFGLLPPLAGNRHDKSRKKELLAERALHDLRTFLDHPESAIT